MFVFVLDPCCLDEILVSMLELVNEVGCVVNVPSEASVVMLGQFPCCELLLIRLDMLS